MDSQSVGFWSRKILEEEGLSGQSLQVNRNSTKTFNGQNLNWGRGTGTIKRLLQGGQGGHRYREEKGLAQAREGTEAAGDGLEKGCSGDWDAQVAGTQITREFESNANCLLL